MTQLLELQKELVNTDVEGEIIIRALSDGKVDSLSVTVGQMVNTGDSLLQVIPENIENYYLILWVPNDAVPYATNCPDSVPIAIAISRPEAPPETESNSFRVRVHHMLSFLSYRILNNNYHQQSNILQTLMQRRKMYAWIKSPFL